MAISLDYGSRIFHTTILSGLPNKLCSNNDPELSADITIIVMARVTLPTQIIDYIVFSNEFQDYGNFSLLKIKLHFKYPKTFAKLGVLAIFRVGTSGQTEYANTFKLFCNRGW